MYVYSIEFTTNDVSLRNQVMITREERVKVHNAQRIDIRPYTLEMKVTSTRKLKIDDFKRILEKRCRGTSLELCLDTNDAGDLYFTPHAPAVDDLQRELHGLDYIVGVHLDENSRIIPVAKNLSTEQLRISQGIQPLVNQLGEVRVTPLSFSSLAVA